jgi:hypothetical protein
LRPLLHAALALACLIAALALPSPGRAAAQVKVAVIVGPVGSLTQTYLNLAEAAAATAERHGATVARAYSPNATPANVLAAVADANVVIYFGHGYGHPSPYGGLDTTRQNGWGLQGPRARGTHDDGLNGYLEYVGEDWIVANARPAPGFVMIYSNTCYAPGASEGGFAPAMPQVAAERVAYYSRKVFAMGGSGYFATDFDRGAADLLDRLLANPRAGYGAIFAGDHRYVPGALTVQPHIFSAGQQIWLHRSRYTDGPPNYWYAFAGNPDATALRSWDPVAPTLSRARPAADATDVAPWAAPKLSVSEAVRGVDSTTVRLLDGDGRPVKADVAYDRRAGTVRLTPAKPLALSARYTVEVGTGITDGAGNALAPASWSFVTRLDADPLTETLPIVLAPGQHRLVRLGDDGSLEERRVEIGAEGWMVARARARLPDVSGTWLEIETASLAGWWVRESHRAHAVGRSEEVILAPTEVSLEIPSDLDAVSVDEPGAGSSAIRRVTVDRRRVMDGRMQLRVVGGLPGPGGRWVEAPADALPTDVEERRILARRHRTETAELRLDVGPHAAFRFDGAGRVLERRSVAGGETPLLATDRTINVAGRRFHVVSDGQLEGWAIADADGVSLTVPESRDPS